MSVARFCNPDPEFAIMRSQESPRRLDPRALVVFLFTLLAPGTAAAVSITPEQAGIGNFGQVNENYFRGAQPDREGFHRLGTLGVKTIIDLQEKGKAEEPGWVKEAGMQYFCVPLSGSHPANDSQTARFLDLVNDPANWPVYVHCAAGRHRTGEMTGIYRITHDTWTADKAYEEMKKYGYYSFPNHGSLKDYVFHYASAYKPAPAAKAITTVAVKTDSLPVATVVPASATSLVGR